MTRLRTRTVAGVAAATLAAAGLSALAAHGAVADDDASGIHVADGRIVEADGTDLVLRGVNHPHAWYTGTTTQALADIKAVDANAVRVVLASGDRWTRTSAAEVAAIVDGCEANRLICQLEVHDTTGYGEQAGAATLDQAADYWEYLYPTLAGTEDHVLVNIGNEPYGNDAATNAGWADDTSAAVQRLRDVGYDHALVVDAPSWGQDWAHIMRDQAPAVAAADPDGNTIFSVHMYGVYSQGSTVTQYLEHFVDAGLPLMIGEFGYTHSDGSVAYDTILAETERLGIGWLAWSWSGNGGGVEYLDLVENFDVGSPSSWGERIFTGPDGLSETSVEASVFGGAPDPDSTPDPTPDPDPTGPPAGAACTAELTVANAWQGGYQAQVTVTAGDTAVDGWITTLPTGVAVAQLWGGTLGDDGATVTPAAWNGSLAAGASTSYGFIGSGAAPSDADVTCAAG
ncbi:mannan endo-1,4-beta-mannosidase [Isoptericola sp. CG 20/1183]|uniref:Endoglucanase n=1 Tax=Isoptericola halotolerans TaxID=300560 RepID=A0ABX5EBC1_9MICO|nr:MULTISPECIES: cellulase family glycosylhydrolase [Isoptericola]PRZ04803.1 mannan endo-1,4-beta-mannosidase [Isoptericola halotolerans]PRZ05294.1 mannan endo-1,4-beta-mannosidase [Isoptericola sp. CG 20/1183]